MEGRVRRGAGRPVTAPRRFFTTRAIAPTTSSSRCCAATWRTTWATSTRRRSPLRTGHRAVRRRVRADRHDAGAARSGAVRAACGRLGPVRRRPSNAAAQLCDATHEKWVRALLEFAAAQVAWQRGDYARGRGGDPQGLAQVLRLGDRRAVPEGLEQLAHVMLATGRPTGRAGCSARREPLRERIGIPLPPLAARAAWRTISPPPARRLIRRTSTPPGKRARRRGRRASSRPWRWRWKMNEAGDSCSPALFLSAILCALCAPAST